MSDDVHEDPQPARERAQPRQDEPEHEPAPADENGAAVGLRRTRLRRLAIVGAVVVVVLAVVVVTAGGSRSPPRADGPQATATEQAIGELLAGIPQSANTLGRPTAPVTLQWYGDLECPFCREFTLGALPAIIRRWVRGGELKIEYLSMQTATRERRVFEVQQVAALAAGLQDRMWNFIETFYHEQGEEDSGYVTERYLDGLAGQIPGLDVSLWSEDRHDPVLAAQVAAERSAAIRARFRGTPSFLLGRSGETMHRFGPRSLTDATEFDEAIEAVG